MTVLAIQNQSIFQPASRKRGSSKAAEKLQEFFEDMEEELKNSVFWNYSGTVATALMETYQESREEDWDGYGAAAISLAAYDEATRFLNALPSSLPAPEIAPEPDGDIGFEWNYGKDRVLVASVSGTNRITYAGLLGAGNKAQGTEVFNDSIPQTLVNHILRISQ